MQLSHLAEQLGFTALWVLDEEREISRGYASDMLSDVLIHAPKGALLTTLQVHLNVVAVAAQAGLAGVVFTNSKRPEAHVIECARIEKIPLFVTEMDTFSTAGRLFAVGVKGREA